MKNFIIYFLASIVPENYLQCFNFFTTEGTTFEKNQGKSYHVKSLDKTSKILHENTPSSLNYAQKEIHKTLQNLKTRIHRLIKIDEWNSGAECQTAVSMQLVMVEMSSCAKYRYTEAIDLNKNSSKYDFLSSCNELECSFIPSLNPNLKDKCGHSSVIECCNKYKIIKSLVDYHQQKKEKIIIFSKYRNQIDSLTKWLFSSDYNVFRFTGEENSKFPGLTKKKDTLEKFEKSKQGILLMTITLGESFNLDHACVAIILEPTWSFIQLDQALGRIIRLGYISFHYLRF